MPIKKIAVLICMILACMQSILAMEPVLDYKNFITCSANSLSREREINALRTRFLSALVPENFSAGTPFENRLSDKKRVDITTIPKKYRNIFAGGVIFLDGKRFASDLFLINCLTIVKEIFNGAGCFLKKTMA